MCLYRVIVVAFHNLTMNCASCDLPSDANTLYCSGSCGLVYHISCLVKGNGQYKNALSTYMNKIPNLKWFCDECVSVHADTESLIEQLTDRLNDIKSFADYLLTKLNPSATTKQNDLNCSKNSNPPPTPTPTNESEQNDQHEKSSSDSNDSFTSAVRMDVDTPAAVQSNVNTLPRKRHGSPLPAASSSSKQQKTKGSLADLLLDPKQAKPADPKITVKTNMMRSIYISPFKPTTEPEDIMDILNGNADLKHIAPNIKCTKLLSKNHRAPLTFVSFKLDVPRFHYDIVASPAVWHVDGRAPISIKEFVVKDGAQRSSPASKSATNDKKPKNNVKSKPSAPAPKTNRNTQSSKSKKGANRQKNGNVKPKSSPKRSHGQRQNFRNGCQKQCCSQTRPRCTPCTDHWEGNRWNLCPRSCR